MKSLADLRVARTLSLNVNESGQRIVDVFTEFISDYPSQTFKKGETILLKNEKPTAVYIIESGLVKTYTITSSGYERVITIDRRGEDFPIGFATGLLDSSQFFYEAFTKCTIRLVPREKYLQHITTNMQSMYKQHVRTTSLLISTLSRVQALEQPTAGRKIAYTLLYVASRFGVILRPTKQLRISITQQEIANSLGLSRETANVELKKLETLKLISHSRKSYTLYTEQLKRYIDE